VPHPPIAALAARGLTLIELMIAIAILAIITTIGVPLYANAVRTARVKKAGEELRVISREFDGYRLANGLQLPASLHEIGRGERLDPWGVPYCYLNYATGTGDGLDWALAAGLVDPAALIQESGGSDVEGGKDKGKDEGGGGIGSDVSDVASPLTGPEVAARARGLIGRSVYVQVQAASVRRRDKFLFPLNTDYDLFSLGPDARSAAALSHPMALDDVIRANDGGYFGPASNY
jgi:general secretion pathway protein G